MKNPFLSDRNIFTNVKNPPKTIEQPNTKKQTKIPSEPIKNPFEKKVQPVYNVYEKTQKPPATQQYVSNFIPSNKVTFGQPRQQQRNVNFDRNLIGFSRTSLNEVDSSNSYEREARQSRKYDPFKMPEFKNDVLNKNTYQSITIQKKDYPTILTKENNNFNQSKFDQFRRNQLKQYTPSPVVQSKLNSSEFLNIDNQGLNKILQESQNQEQLCRLLGIQRKVQPKQYVPTFNYNGLQAQNETVSRFEDHVPSFKPIQSNIKQVKKQFYPKPQEKAHKIEQLEQIPVFNYASTKNEPKRTDSLSVQQIIQSELSELSRNGKYRVFLTATQKITTIEYKVQYI